MPCLNPTPTTTQTGTNRMEYKCLPEELLINSCDWLPVPTSNRFHAAREKKFSSKRKNVSYVLDLLIVASSLLAIIVGPLFLL